MLTEGDLSTQNIDLDKRSYEDPTFVPRKPVLDCVHDPQIVALRGSFNENRRSEALERSGQIEKEQYKLNVFKLMRTDLLKGIKGKIIEE